MTEIVIYGPDEAAKARLREDFGVASADWRRRADEIEAGGDAALAMRIRRIAAIGATVARGGAS